MEPLEPLVHLEKMDLMEPLAMLEHPGKMERTALLAQLDLQDLRELVEDLAKMV